MDIRQLTPRYYVAPQINAEDMPALKEAGITRILCNRPDVEVPPSHQAAAIGAAAKAAGIAFETCPLDHQSMVPDVIALNRDKAAQDDGIVLAYCASGTRSTIAWALAQAGDMAPAEIIETARAGGYDIAHLEHVLQVPFT